MGASPAVPSMRPDSGISVIVPTWNEAATLPPLLESIGRQTMRPLEVIVADSSSTDRTPEIATAFGARYLNGERKGVAEGRNRGAHAAAGEVFLFVDADCVMPDDLIAQVVAALKDSEIIGGATMFRPLDGTPGERLLFFLANAFQRATIYWGFPHNAGFCFFFRRTAFERLGGLREDLFLNETHDIALRSRSLGPFISLPVAVGTSMRRFRRHGFAQTVLHEYFESTLLYYLTGQSPPEAFRPQPVR